MYSVCVTDRNESIVIELGEKGRVVRAAGEAETAPDVSVNISSSDLAGVLKVVPRCIGIEIYSLVYRARCPHYRPTSPAGYPPRAT